MVGFLLVSFKVIIITGLNKLYSRMFSPSRSPQTPAGRKTPTQTKEKHKKRRGQMGSTSGHGPIDLCIIVGGVYGIMRNIGDPLGDQWFVV